MQWTKSTVKSGDLAQYTAVHSAERTHILKAPYSMFNKKLQNFKGQMKLDDVQGGEAIDMG